MGYIADATILALRGNPVIGIFFRLGTTPPLHLAFALNDIPIYIPGLDDPATIYTGAGQFTDIKEFEVLINGIADKVSFGLNGINAQNVNMIMDTAPAVLGAVVTIGIATMNQYWQPTSNIIPLWTGVGDYISVDQKTDNDPTKNTVQEIILTCSAGDTSRSQPSLQTATDRTQKARFPTDRFFERVTRYVQGLLITWPKY